jgi:raffinose/stachyose/melibiose transport system substrate-binding protein
VARHIVLVLILCLGAWALWPHDDGKGRQTEAAGEDGSQRKYTIRMTPGIYMPGRRPMNLGKPLQGFNKVKMAFEKLYPDTSVEFTEAPVSSREYLVTQLAAEQAPDILNVNVEDVWQDVHKGWYVPLDEYLNLPNPFVKPGEPGSRQWWDMFKYQAISRGKGAPDGKMYCISYDMIETGIFYNKDIFRRLGLRTPKDWPEFLAIQEKVRRAGIIPMLAGSSDIADWGMDLIFDQLYNEVLPGIDLVKDPVREAYMDGYLDWDELSLLFQKGFFTKADPRFRAVFRELKKWRQHFQKNLTSDLTKLFVTQEAAMWWSSSVTVNRLVRDPDVKFDWGVFYLPPMPKSYNRFADGHDQVVIGGSGTQLEVTNSAFNDTGNPATSEKLKRVIAFIQFMCTPQNSDIVVNEMLAFLPNIVGSEPKPELRPFHEFLQRKYTTTKWLFTFDLRFNEIYRRMLDLYLNGGLSEEEFMDWMESNLNTATKTLLRRKNLDLSKLEAEWTRLAPLRSGMAGLPSTSGGGP